MIGEKVVILMATYNGASFLAQQLDSIINQTYSHWVLYVRDDLSSDDTVAILKSYATADHRIRILELPGPHGSPALNFGALFNYVVATSPNYLLFADQDDVWQPDKIELSLNYIKTLELSEGKVRPLLIYSSFKYIDDKGSIINQELEMPTSLNMSMLLMANYAYGCTMLMNEALIQKVKTLSEKIEYHDYWFSLAAVAFGKAVLFPRKTLNYRQHQQNASTNIASRSFSARFQRYVKNPVERLDVLIRQNLMIRLFLLTYKDQLKLSDEELLGEYFISLKRSSAKLVWFMVSKGVKKIGFTQTLAHLYALVRLRAKVVFALGN